MLCSCWRSAITLPAALLVLAASPWSQAAQAATYHVDPDGVGDFPTIQAALDACATGDSILLSPGTYHGDGNRDLVFPPHDLSLIGSAGSAQTILDVDGGDEGYYDLHLGITIDAGQSRDCLVQGLKVVDGRFFYDTAGVSVRNADPSLRDIVIEDFDGAQEHYGQPRGISLYQSNALLVNVEVIGGPYSAGISIYAGAPVLSEVTVRGCSFEGNGAGISIWNSGATLTGISVSYCVSWWAGGGGIFITGTPTPNLDDVSIRDCSVSVHLNGDPAVGGGGLYILDSSPMLTDLEIIDCDSVYEGGGIYIDGGACEIERALLQDNESASYGDPNPHPGAGVYLKDAWPFLKQLTILGSHGTAVFADGESSLELTYSIVADGWRGSALGKGANATCFVSRCDFWNNVGGSTDGSLPDPVGQYGCFAAYPCFCGDTAPANPFSLASNSPCAQEQTGWESVVGAYGVGCDVLSYMVAGRVRDDGGAPLAGVQMDGFPTTVTTNTDGIYYCAVSPGVELVVSPQRDGYLFAPLFRHYSAIYEHHVGDDYVGTLDPTATPPATAYCDRLRGSHPNPFNPSTLISFTLAAPGKVILEIFDLSGRRVVRLLDEPRDRGLHAVHWSGCDERGAMMASGIYIARLDLGHYQAMCRLVLLR